MYIMLGYFVDVKTFALAMLLIFQSSAGKNRNETFFNTDLRRKLLQSLSQVFNSSMYVII